MGTPYRVCEHCGAHLDANEKCDCRNPKQEETAAEAQPMKLVAVCREVDKDTGRIAVYKINTEITGAVVQQLQIRLTRNCGISRLRRDGGSGSGT